MNDAALDSFVDQAVLDQAADELAHEYPSLNDPYWMSRLTRIKAYIIVAIQRMSDEGDLYDIKRKLYLDMFRREVARATALSSPQSALYSLEVQRG